MQKKFSFLVFINFKNVLYRLAHWETWDWRIKYIPLIPAWLGYSLRSRSLWFFTPSNPSITFGGFTGENKKDIYDQLPPGSYPKSVYISPALSFTDAKMLIASHQFQYPFAVKPQIARMGFMFRKIHNPAEFESYHKKMPFNYIVQDFINYPLEISVFYYRFPNQQKGTITGFIRKELLEVKGDGKATLLELILAYPRVRFMVEEMKSKHEKRLNEIIPAGEIFVLSNALNLSRGGKLISLAHEKDERLLKVFDDLSHHTHFYYGRYDIKCDSVEDLKAGKNFSILEFNGCGGEPHHVYGNRYTLWQACRILLHHWKVLYQISKYNHQNGIPYWKFKEGWKFFHQTNREIAKLKKLDAEFPIY